MQFSYIFLVLAVAAVSSEIIDINSAVDKGLAQTNEFLRKHRFTSVHVPKGSFGPHVFFSDSDVLGLDSLKRTGNCTLEVVKRNVTIDFHYGFGFYQQSFKILSISDQDQSASIRIRDNSVRLYYTADFSGNDGLNCSVTLHDLSFERLAKVDFSSSRSEFDGADVEEIFEKEVVPFLNNKIDKAAVEKALQQQICKQQHQEVSEQMPMIHMSILQQIGVSAQ